MTPTSPRPGKAEVELRTLGRVQLLLGGSDVTGDLDSQSLALLIYLAHEARPMSPIEVRRMLDLPEPDEEEGGPDALGELVRGLRRVLPDVHLALTSDTVQVLNGVWLDASAVGGAIDRGDLPAVARLVEGGFLAEFEAPTSAFEGWVRKERQRLRRAWMGRIERAAAEAERAGRPEAGNWRRVLSERLSERGKEPDDVKPGPSAPRRPAMSKRAAAKPAAPRRIADPTAIGPSTTPRVEVLNPRIVERVKKRAPDEVFTDSLAVHYVKTGWARLTSPAAIKEYLAFLGAVQETAINLSRFGLEVLLWLADRGWDLLKAAGRSARTGARHTGRAAGRAGKRMARAPKVAATAVGSRLGAAASAVGTGIGAAGSAVRTRAEATASAARSHAGATASAVRTRAGATASSVRTGAREAASRVRSGAGTAAASASGFGPAARRGLSRARGGLAGLVRMTMTTMRALASGWRCATAVAKSLGSALRWTWARPLARPILLAGALLMTVPLLRDFGNGLVTDVARRLPTVTFHRPRVTVPDVSIPSVSLPDVDLPKLQTPALHAPNIRVPAALSETPELLRRSGTRLTRMLVGPIVPPGGRVLVADFEDPDSSSAGLGHALALAMESYLAEGRYAAIVPRERAETALGSDADGLGLSREEALAVARKVGYEAVVAGRIARQDEAYALELTLLDTTASIRYETSQSADSSELPMAVERAARDLRRAFGEASGTLDATLVDPVVFSNSLPALRAYARARAALFAGRYSESAAAARQSLEADSTFALAHHVMAEAYALSGHRALARGALEATWRDRGRLPRRERIRLLAERYAFDHHYPAAIQAYEQLFQKFRDDVGALKSQFILRNAVSAGTGEGNLAIARSRDPVDWPPLSLVARYLGAASPALTMR